MSKKFIFTVISVVLFICAVDSLSAPIFTAWLILNSVMVYLCYKMFKGKSDDEISKLTGYNKKIEE